MNEAELVAETIATIKRDGWVTGWLAHPGGQHCILGAIGKARWGEMWDENCNDDSGWFRAYDKLSEDPATRSLVDRIIAALVAKGELSEYQVVSEYDRHPAVYGWNDDEASEEEILDVLEKVQAEIG